METLESLRSGLASGRLTGCTSLKLSDGLTKFPNEILALADSLTFLNLSNNRLSHLPSEFAQLKQLKIVFFNNNHFEDFPAVLAQCPLLSMVSFKANRIRSIGPMSLSPTLRWLILTNNQLSSLPATVGNLPKLQKLMLAGNQLSSLPCELANCTNLELIRVSANRLETLPMWLLSMPRLAWLAYAGNPCHPAGIASEQEKALLDISSAEIQRGDVLGEGASGVIYKGTWTPTADAQGSQLQAATKSQEVAIKLFKGEITSDGSPLDEMKVCIAAGAHPNLVTVLGKYRAAEKRGLIFDFISPDYKNLGNPPSLDSCTRDTYDEGTSFTLSKLLRLVRGVASAVQHLHNRNVMHGDLYAHNILTNSDGDSFLGDFGAASFYDAEEVGKALEKIEVRAFGCLLEDLLERCSSTEVFTIEALREIEKRCTHSVPVKRPSFQQIGGLLVEIAKK